MTSSTTVRPVGMYRLRRADGTLLYIGIGYDPASRIAAHRREKPWWCDVDEGLTTIEWIGSREMAETVELAAIRDEKPLHNIVTGDDHGCARFLPQPDRRWGRPVTQLTSEQTAVLAEARRLSERRDRIRAVMWAAMARGRQLDIPDTILCDESGESRSTLNRRLGTRSGGDS